MQIQHVLDSSCYLWISCFRSRHGLLELMLLDCQVGKGTTCTYMVLYEWGQRCDPFKQRRAFEDAFSLYLLLLLYF